MLIKDRNESEEHFELKSLIYFFFKNNSSFNGEILVGKSLKNSSYIIPDCYAQLNNYRLCFEIHKRTGRQEEKEKERIYNCSLNEGIWLLKDGVPPGKLFSAKNLFYYKLIDSNTYLFNTENGDKLILLTDFLEHCLNYLIKVSSLSRKRDYQKSFTKYLKYQFTLVA